MNNDTASGPVATMLMQVKKRSFFGRTINACFMLCKAALRNVYVSGVKDEEQIKTDLSH